MQQILKKWTFIRAVRLLGGSFLIINGLVEKEYLFVGLGGVLLWQSLANKGCGGGSCSV